MKKFIYGGLAIVAVAAIVLTLMSNKKKIEEKNANNFVQTEFPVKAATVRDSMLSNSLSMIGTAIANNEVNVTAEATGRITKCLIQVGQHVSAGEVLYLVDDEVRMSQLKTAEANFEKAQKDSARSKFLFAEKSLSAAQWDQIELQYKLAEQQLVMARRAYNDTRIKSPISGVVVARFCDVGSMVNNAQSGTTVCTIMDLSKIKIRLQVAEHDVVQMREGQSVSVHSEIFPDENFSGVISTISAKGDEAHTYPVEVTVQNTGKNQIRPGMFARVSFSSVMKGASLVIPREAIVGSMKDAKVYRIDSNKAYLTSVVLGDDVNGLIEVRSGLKSGDKVVVTGQNMIGNGSTVKVL